MEILKEVARETLLKSSIKNGSKWNLRGEFMEERINGLGVWDDHGNRVNYKVLDILEYT